MEALFDDSNASNNGAILQLMIYCLWFEYYQKNSHGEILKDTDIGIKPMIYKLRTINTEGIGNIKVNKPKLEDAKKTYKEDLLNYKDFLEDTDNGLGFKTLFHKLLTDLFDPNVPFKQTENEAKCKYCKFKVICGREEKKEKF
jgi:hypothetical protein